MRLIVLVSLSLLAACKTSEPASSDPAGMEPTPEPMTAPAPEPQMAEGMEEVALFGGRTGTATRHHAPADNTVEHAIHDSLMLLAAEDYDTWMDRYCDPEACDDERKREAMTSHVLPSAKMASSSCLHDGDVLVTKQEVDGDYTKTWIYCGESRMPAPSTARSIDGSWRFSSVSW